MRLALKNTLVLIAVYLLFAVGFALWLDHEWRQISTRIINRTAHLIAREVATVVSQPALEQLVYNDDMARQRLQQIVSRLAEHSDIVESVAVVDEAGRVVASDPPLEEERPAPLPAVVFDPPSEGKRPRPKVVISETDGARLGQYNLFVPLTYESGASAVGYVRLTINSDHVASLHKLTHSQFFVAAMLGLLGMGALGLVLHVQLARRSQTLAQALEAAISGIPARAADPRDEFAHVIDVARKVGVELSEERAKSMQAHARLAAMLRVTEVGVVLLRPLGDIDFASSTARELFGWPAPGSLEAHWGEVKPRIVAHLGAATGAAQSGRFDLELNVDGVPRVLHIQALRLETGEDLLLVKDREMMDALERELGLAIQMRGLVRFHRAFVHDLKTPLNAMIMYLELLKNSLTARNTVDADAEGALQEKQRRYIEVLKDEISRVDRQARSLLTHTAPPRDGLARVDVRDLVEELVTLIRPMAAHQHVNTEVRVVETPLWCEVNRDRLKQALLNIAINGLEAMPDGGKLTVDLQDCGERARIAIADTGPGIPAEVEEQVFRLHFTTKERGTGIGLHVAKSVVDAARGEIRLEEVPGSTTCFAVYLPLASPESPAESADRAAKNSDGVSRAAG